MTKFQLVTEWRLSASLAEVFEAITHCLDWPKWWLGSEKVEKLVMGDKNGVECVHRFIWKGRIPYRLVFDIRVTRIVPLKLIEGQASGEVVGTGRWNFFHEDGVTVVRYEWDVYINRLWMNLVAPLALPLFRWNHHQVMQQGAKGLAHLLHSRLESVHTSVPSL
jgi:hypothetical protein